jgi:WD40 repeat protein
LAGQLTGRLLGNTSPNMQALLKQAAERKVWPWLRPLKPNLTAPGGSLIRTLGGHMWDVAAVAVTPDGRHIVSASYDDTLRVWDLQTGETKATLVPVQAEPPRRFSIIVVSDRCFWGLFSRNVVWE